MAASWQPSASHAILKQRADFNRSIRQFFYDRHVLEVETPCLSADTVTDPHLYSFKTELLAPGVPAQTYYLQTSPEFHMKRLLAAGSGAIFQLAKVFRNEERGRLHNPEFTMLEWYQPGYDHHDLMAEVDALMQAVCAWPAADKISYRDLFIRDAQIDIATIDLAGLKQCLSKFEIQIDSPLTFDDCLHLILTHHIEPNLGQDKPIFIYDFPKSQAALARVRNDDYPVAERFECYYQGIELANGFHELSDADEQLRRFESDNHTRSTLGLPPMPISAHLLASLNHGLPDCAGVAMGVDRLFMLKTQLSSIDQAISFDILRA